MPVHVRAKMKGEKGKPFKIVEDGTGKVVGESDDRRKAEISASYRNAIHKKKMAGKKK
jgi:hypothetical protein